MKFLPTRLAGVMQVELEPHRDDRGGFARAYCETEFRQHGLDPVGLQSNISTNDRCGTLRGLHYQAEPAGEPKLVRCIAGRIFDVVVDLRDTSSSRHHWIADELTAERGNALYIPRGCAHGFLTLTDRTTVFYQMGAAYDAAFARGVRWNDPAFNIAWPFPPSHISERDASYPDTPR